MSAPGGRLTGPQLAQRLGWPHSKIYKLENGKQTASASDLRAWADAVETPHAYDELETQLRGFELHIRSWRRQLAEGHRPVQDSWNLEADRSAVIHAWEEAVIPGMLQTPDYARDLRQRWLYDGRHRLHVLVWEAALHALICSPSIMVAQLDRLVGVIGMDTVELGIIPLSASLKIPAANGFWIFDERLVITEDWHAEVWLNDADSLATYLRIWRTLRESAVYGADAHAVIARARRAVQSGA